MSQNEFSPRQVQAIAALASGLTVTAASQQAQVSRRTLTRWLADPIFCLAVSRETGEIMARTSKKLAALAEQAVSSLESLLDDPAVTAGAKLRAIEIILSNATRLHELVELTARIERLEGMIHEREN